MKVHNKTGRTFTMPQSMIHKPVPDEIIIEAEHNTDFYSN